MTTRISFDDRLLTFRPAVRPLIALGSGVRRGLAVDCVVELADGDHSAQPWFRRLPQYDVERLDLAAIDEGIEQLAAAGAAGALMMMAAAFSTLAAPHGRREVLRRAVEVRQKLKAMVLLEITALDPTLPQSRLAEMVGLVRPACKAVFARLTPTRRVLQSTRESGLDGAALEAADLKHPESAEAMADMVTLLHAVGPRVVLHRLRSVAAIEAAHRSGATYASLEIAEHPRSHGQG